MADGKSTVLSSKEPPPCIDVVALDLVRNIITFRSFRNRRRRSTDTGTGSERTATPPSCERGEGGGSVVALRRAPSPKRISAATKTPDRPRHPLHDAAGRPLLNPRLYTDGIRGFPTLPPP